MNSQRQNSGTPEPDARSPRALGDTQSRPHSQFDGRPSIQNDRNSANQDPEGASLAGSRSGSRGPQYPPQAAPPTHSVYAQSIAPSARVVTTQSVVSKAPPVDQPLLDHSHLRPGKEANLLSHERTLELYRANARKSNDPDVQYEFAMFMIDASKSLPLPRPTAATNLRLKRSRRSARNSRAKAFSCSSAWQIAATATHSISSPTVWRMELAPIDPARTLIGRILWTCCENGWGCRRESAKAVQFFRKAAAALHPGALYRLGIAELNGELGLSKRPKEGVKWLKRSAEHATAEFPHALHELALLHERGVDNVLFVDYEYSAELLAQASELGYAPSAYRLGECYEYGKMGCPQDAALSIHYYNIAAQQDHRDACFALTAWYLVGSPGVLPQSDTEAYLWAKKAAEQGLAKAMYAVGYFSEVGVGTTQSLPDAMHWYKRAAEAGDKRAIQRLKATSGGPLPGNVISREQATTTGDVKDKNCVIM
ncbi:Protein SKT5 [Rhizoctonia solani]|uniref:Protein SKT5 n=1 Tax=Rhizoctonia solani TaxID=456999 RepID=A0A0K6FMI0_9AGAM|nr:Protein SKT5 [Rhizoctonia solani]